MAPMLDLAVWIGAMPVFPIRQVLTPSFSDVSARPTPALVNTCRNGLVAWARCGNDNEPHPGANSGSLQPRSDRACRRAERFSKHRACQGQALRAPAAAAGVTTLGLRPPFVTPAAAHSHPHCRAPGRTKEWNLPTQYPKRSPIFAEPHRRRHVRYQSGPPFTAAPGKKDTSRPIQFLDGSTIKNPPRCSPTLTR